MEIALGLSTTIEKKGGLSNLSTADNQGAEITLKNN
jgi:hypothetical protein